MFDALLAHLVVIRSRDTYRRTTEIRISPASLQHQVDIRLCGPRQDRPPPTVLVRHDFHHTHALFRVEPNEFARAAVWVKTVNAFLDEPTRHAPQFGLIDGAVRSERHNVRSVNAVDRHL